VRISKDVADPAAPVAYDAVIGSPLPSAVGGDGQPAPDDATNGEDSFGRVISDDGSRVFFSTRNALTRQATQGVRSIYEYEHGSVTLVSPGGPGASDAYYQDSTPDGSDVFFTTREQLTPGDHDGGATDVYDARIDGGFPSPSLEPEGCAQSNTCPASGPSAAGTPVSSLFVLPANPPPAPAPAAAARPRPLTRAQKLARALHACERKHNRSRRRACAHAARRRYGARRHR
jgi:hypothetical protein